jgi:predicted membrane chloride channel (bestrophin family)
MGQKFIMSKLEKRFLLVLFFSIAVVPAAQAYLDPASITFLIHSIVAALIGAVFMLRNYWARIKAWFTKEEIKPQDSSKQSPTTSDVSVDRQEK